MNQFDTEQFTSLFLDEMMELLQIMDEELLRLEKDGKSEEGIQSLFRAAHTLKGSSAAMGYENVKSLTHEMEQVLDEIRHDRLEINGTVIDLLFSCLDCLQTMQESLREGKADHVPVEQLVEQLQRTANQHEIAIDQHKMATDRPNQHKRQPKYLNISIRISPSCEMKLARAILIHNKLLEHVQIIHCKPSLDDALEDSEYERIEIFCHTTMDAAQLEQMLLTLMDVEEVGVQEEHHEGEVASLQSGKPSAGETKRPSNKRKSITSIRMNVEHLEQVMNLVGELVIDQTRIHQVKRNLQRKFQSDEDVMELGLVSDHVNRVVTELQESVMKARMLPIEQLFNRFPRMVRDLSHQLNKEVELVLDGHETELDRSLIEEIADPVIHLIRNALDHGIEPPSERIRKGKPAKGRLMIKAVHEDNQVVISVEDDGAGIDADKIRKSAVQKGLLTEDEARRLTDQEAVQLIFESGFSTASEVSDVSGRGVGMDIVRSDIERLNGLLDIRTRPGEGTQFRIRLPLTLAIVTGLLIKIGHQTFILPMSNVVEIMRVDASEVQIVHGEEVIKNRDRILPLVRLHERFQIRSKSAEAKGEKKLPIVIVGTAEKRIALLVDDLVGNQDIVIKSLGSYLGKIDCISGATILGDGRVAPILEVSDIMKHR